MNVKVTRKTRSNPKAESATLGILNDPPQRLNYAEKFFKEIRTQAAWQVLKGLVNGLPKGLIGTVQWRDGTLSRDYAEEELELAVLVASEIEAHAQFALAELLLAPDFKFAVTTAQKRRWARQQAERQKAEKTGPYEAAIEANPNLPNVQILRLLLTQGKIEEVLDVPKSDKKKPELLGYKTPSARKYVKLSSMDSKLSRIRNALRNKTRKK